MFLGDNAASTNFSGARRQRRVLLTDFRYCFIYLYFCDDDDDNDDDDDDDDYYYYYYYCDCFWRQGLGL